MIIYRATRYRIYPTAEQATRMVAWQQSLRWLWNLAHEQRLMGLARLGSARIYVKYLQQQAELTELRATLPWLAEVPCSVCQCILRDLDKAWDRAFKKLAMAPRWKSKRGPAPALFCSAPGARVDGGAVVFPKLGAIKAMIHRAVQGTVKTVQLLRDVDQWFAVVMCAVEVAEPAPHTGPAVGIDRGVVNAITDSEGRKVRFYSRHSGGGAACGGVPNRGPVMQEARPARVATSGQGAPEVAPCAGEEADAHVGIMRILPVAPCAGEEARDRQPRAAAAPVAPCAGEEATRPAAHTGAPVVAPCAGEEAGATERSDSGTASAVAFRDSAWELLARERIAKASRDIARKVEAAKAEGRKADGANIAKARERLAKLHRKLRRQREYALQVESKRYAEQYGTIAVERLEVKAMTASAKGTAAEPGKNVRQKAGLNRGILSAAWGKFAGLLKYKAAERGGRVVEVPAAYSSQTCHMCGHVAAENRPDQATFECVACGLVEHADVNAAKVIMARGLAGQVAAPRAPKKTLRVVKRARKGSAAPQTAGVQPVEACGGDPTTGPVEAGTPCSKAETSQGAEHVSMGETSRVAA